MSDTDADLAAWWAALEAKSENRQAALDAAHLSLVSAGALSKVTTHRYLCRLRGCPIATVFQIGDVVACAVRDYKLSPGVNLAESTKAGRERNTLDGRRHWPSHVYDVRALVGFLPDAGMSMNCRHRHGTVLAADVLAAVDGVRPGHPGAPTRL
jgi:hypothetical protein